MEFIQLFARILSPNWWYVRETRPRCLYYSISPLMLFVLHKYFLFKVLRSFWPQVSLLQLGYRNWLISRAWNFPVLYCMLFSPAHFYMVSKYLSRELTSKGPLTASTVFVWPAKQVSVIFWVIDCNIRKSHHKEKWPENNFLMHITRYYSLPGNPIRWQICLLSFNKSYTHTPIFPTMTNLCSFQHIIPRSTL